MSKKIYIGNLEIPKSIVKVINEQEKHHLQIKILYDWFYSLPKEKQVLVLNE